MTKRNVEQHLPVKAPKKTGRSGIGPVPEPEPPTSEEVAEFLDGAAATREKRKEKAKKPQVVKDPPQAQRLPGMEDASIDEIEDAARDYAQVRDKRMALTNQEVDQKDLLLTLMRRHGKKKYHHDGILIEVVPESEKLKVRIEEE